VRKLYFFTRHYAIECVIFRPTNAGEQAPRYCAALLESSPRFRRRLMISIEG